MAASVLTNCKLYVGGYDLSGYANRLGIELVADAVEATTFGQSWKVRRAGIKTARFTFGGYFEADATGVTTYKVDDVMWSEIGTGAIVTIGPTTGADGEAAYAHNSITGAFTPLTGSHGAMASMSAAFEGDGQVYSGRVLKNGTVDADGNGTAYQLGAVGSTQYVWAALHVLSVSASDSVVLHVESDSTQSFLSATDVITFTSAAALGAEWKQSAIGPISDTWWRARWDVTGSGVSIAFILSMGIA